jgi:hypothetical protein
LARGNDATLLRHRDHVQSRSPFSDARLRPFD